MEWPEVLDRFEERMRRLRAVLDSGGEPPTDTWPPADLTDRPLPEALTGRARALMAEAARLEADLEAALAGRPVPEHARSTRRPVSGRSTFSKVL